ncbi:aspartyl-phosphate phosphatase Spo0E family protein [Cohnella fermenti]|uniref:Aspartyl-phosphate phosphatase Spo0E family protein n=2 Tax=Cohnella fermenti TaxID=2565925 RepID=A0A4S4BVP0_9BACL|nr:aspartyl-phosphate phosphatase Spo0E family protein [Cohnella fermenti]THF77073.1 aspartyl-phosphate phosphatase Spo0E family protein [Cohnella fermenti]
MDNSILIHRLEMLQNRLYDMANDLGNLTDPEIVAVSEEADRLIIQLQKSRMDHCKSRQPVHSLALFANSKSSEEVGQEHGALFLKHS